MTLPSLAFIGAGAMGGAILRGVVASGAVGEGQIFATNRTDEKARMLTGPPGVTSLSLAENPQANLVAAASAQIVLIGVKPAMVLDTLIEIAPVLNEDAIVVSLAAGVTLATFAQALGPDASVVRAMPNTPATVGAAVTGLAANKATTSEELAQVTSLFASVGEVVVVPETQIDALSTISGSGPAYVYLLMDALADAARGKGFDDSEARLMAEQTFIGAVALLRATGETPAELRRQVTSPNGTTERAISVLTEADLGSLFAAATDAALARARELAAGT